MLELYHVYEYRFISVKRKGDESTMEGRTFKELDISGSLSGHFKTMYYSLTTPNVKLKLTPVV